MNRQNVMGSLQSQPARCGNIESSSFLRDLWVFGSRPSDLIVMDLLKKARQKDEFLATLAHELRNPLAPIQTALDSMGLMELNPELESLRTMMSRQVDQLVHLIEDLTDVSRIQSSKIAVRKEVTSLRAILESAVEASSPLICKSGQLLTIPAWRDDDFIFGDAAKLIQVFTNLLNNAAKYSKAGSHIELTIEREPGFVAIAVHDDGRGIAVDQLKKIFELYVQFGGIAERHPPGLGIGLSLVKALVELHGGTVQAASAGLGKGSCFTVRLPTGEPSVAIKSGSTGLGKDKTRPNAGQVNLKPCRPKRVLLVEDLRPLRVMLAKLLEKMGHRVETADNGGEAMEKLDRFKPDIVFSDISMPGISGYELARKLRRRADLSAVYLVAMTGSDTAQDRKLALESGFDEHLSKPIDFRELRNVMDRLPLQFRCLHSNRATAR